MDPIISGETPALDRIQNNVPLKKIKYAWDMTDTVRIYKQKEVPFRVTPFVRSLLDGTRGRMVSDILLVCDGVLIKLKPYPYIEFTRECLNHLDVVKQLLVLLHNEHEEGFIRDLPPVLLLHHDRGYLIRFDTPTKRDHVVPDTPYPPIQVRRQLVGVHRIFKEFAQMILEKRAIRSP